VSTRRSDPAGWLLRPAENVAAVPHRARFRRWVASGERTDYADVVIEPPLEPAESGISETLSRVILAPRHRGVTLKSLTQFPADVYVVTAPDDLLDAQLVEPDALKIRIWGVLDGVIQDT
jgi:hypothetical protein